MTLSGPSAAASGPSAAATCLTFKTPPAASLYAGIPIDIIFLGLQNSIPSLFFTGHVRTTENGKCLNIMISNRNL